MKIKKTEIRTLVLRLAGIFCVTIGIFTYFYFLLLNHPGNGLKLPEHESGTIWHCLYFSVVTITTLGYGDITPLGYSRLLAASEALFGLIYVGYAISQVVSFKQEKLTTYLAKDRIIQTYDFCLADLADAKEAIGDRRREIQAKHPTNHNDYFYYRKNPFYPALRSIVVITAYTTHVEDADMISLMPERIDRAAHHVEEIGGFVRKLVNVLDSEKIVWQTDRTKKLLIEICNAIEGFSLQFTRYTKYAEGPYKGGGHYSEVVQGIVQDIRRKLPETVVRYRVHNFSKK